MSEIKLIDANALKKHKFTTQIANGVKIEDIDVVPVAAIDNAQAVDPVCPVDFPIEDDPYPVCPCKPSQVKWVPVSERLPDKNMPCLVSVGKFNLTEIAIYSDLMGTISHKIFYQGDYGKNNFQNITEYVNAWQPLPEQYKKEGEGE
jgi:hypothetical protein